MHREGRAALCPASCRVGALGRGPALTARMDASQPQRRGRKRGPNAQCCPCSWWMVGGAEGPEGGWVLVRDMWW